MDVKELPQDLILLHPAEANHPELNPTHSRRDDTNLGDCFSIDVESDRSRSNAVCEDSRSQIGVRFLRRRIIPTFGRRFPTQARGTEPSR